ncbi:MAG: DUF5714 domain-containing protein [Bacilli bacterium]|jgi:hypothetical protein
MQYTLKEKYELIRKDVLLQTSRSPIHIVKEIMHKDYISLHGPEHHFLDGAAFLIAFKNAGGVVDIEKSLDELANRSLNMPGAMCGFWGVCGSTTSVGAALAIINNTGPLSDDEFYKDNMEFTSSVIARMSEIGGPRCCKRNAFLSISSGAVFVKEKYGVEMEISDIKCEFSILNKQCLLTRCPYYHVV